MPNFFFSNSLFDWHLVPCLFKYLPHVSIKIPKIYFFRLRTLNKVLFEVKIDCSFSYFLLLCMLIFFVKKVNSVFNFFIRCSFTANDFKLMLHLLKWKVMICLLVVMESKSSSYSCISADEISDVLIQDLVCICFHFRFIWMSKVLLSAHLLYLYFRSEFKSEIFLSFGIR